MERLSIANLKVNINKCAFSREEVIVLELKFPKTEKTQIPPRYRELNELQPPKNVSGVKQILGIFNFYQKFIPNFATLADPIVELNRGKMSKNSKIKWDQRHNKCLLVLKNELSLAYILKYPNFMKEFVIEMDTSQIGLGAVLTQEYKVEGEKFFMPVLYASRSLKGARGNIA